jgi:SAM-dependent methyltransferase
MGYECRVGSIDTGAGAKYLPAMTAQQATTSGERSVVQTKYTRTNAITRRLMDGYFKAFADLVAGLDIESAFEPGCGEGFSTKRIRSILPARVSLEASELDGSLVQSAVAANPGVVVRQESVYQIGRQDKSVDLVILLEVLEHLDDPGRAMAEICRVSRKYVIVGVPREPLWRLMNLARLKYVGGLGNTPGHIRHWSAGSFQRFVGRVADVRGVRKPLPWTMVLAAVR